MDTTGNGVGDLNGITQKLDYVAELGVDAIWISPFLKGPQADYGYDISDYCEIDPLFGNLDDFQNLLNSAHERGLKLIMDMVMSHTSDQHPWFEESKQNKTNPKADYYVWADPKPDGSPPNNWLSVFGGSAWQFYPLRGQYYLHNYLKEQPDLNYHNPEVKKSMLEFCRFWLDQGVDGFRLDVVNYCYHDKLLRNNPPYEKGVRTSRLGFPDTYNMQAHLYDKTQPENLDFMKEIRQLLNEYPDQFSVAEIHDDEQIRTSSLYTHKSERLHTAYNFSMLGDGGNLPPASFFRDTINEQLGQFRESWPSWAFSNHDVPRAPSRWSGEQFIHKTELSKLLPIMLCSLRGTVFMYQGDELGLPEAEVPFEDLLDPWGLYFYPRWQGRDGARTPFPWDGSNKGGFTKAEKPWLPITRPHLDLNAKDQDKDEHSTLNTVRRFLDWRKTQQIMRTGDIEFIDLPEPILAFERHANDERIVCLFNLSEDEQKISLLDVNISPRNPGEFRAENTIIGDNNITLPAYGFVFARR